MGLLKKGAIPPYPQYYELLFTYATGTNPDLNNRINVLFNEAGDGSFDLAEKLYTEFLRARDVEERLNRVSERISAKIDSVHGAINTAVKSAGEYSGSLDAAHTVLGTEISQQDLRALTEQLLADTKRMRDTNRTLEMRLDSARADVQELQSDLDAVRRESMLDPLTRVYNRKAFDMGLERAMADSRLGHASLSLILFDIDHFKLFNDNYGHQTGDQVLRLVANTLKANIKGQDLAARYGGEEFAAILPTTSLDAAIKLSEKIRAAIAAKELLKRSTNEKLGRITASFGVAQFRPDDTANTFVERADRCLYAAKRTGRNKVVAESDADMQAAVA